MANAGPSVSGILEASHRRYDAFGSVAWRPLFVSNDVVTSCGDRKRLGAHSGARRFAA